MNIENVEYKPLTLTMHVNCLKFVVRFRILFADIIVLVTRLQSGKNFEVVSIT